MDAKAYLNMLPEQKRWVWFETKKRPLFCRVVNEEKQCLHVLPFDEIKRTFGQVFTVLPSEVHNIDTEADDQLAIVAVGEQVAAHQREDLALAKSSPFPLRGILVNVLRPAAGDSSLEGQSSRFGGFILCGPGLSHIAEADNLHPPLRLMVRRDGCKLFLWSQPIQKVPTDQRPMFGGNFIWSSSDHFRKLSDYPIGVHDRFE